MATQLEPDARADENAFRTEVQEFIAANFPEELKNRGKSSCRYRLARRASCACGGWVS